MTSILQSTHLFSPPISKLVLYIEYVFIVDDMNIDVFVVVYEHLPSVIVVEVVVERDWMVQYIHLSMYDQLRPNTLFKEHVLLI